MTAKEYLSQLRRLGYLIDHEILEYSELMTMAEATSSPALKERVQTSNVMEPMDNVLEAVEISKKIKELQCQYIRQRRLIVDQIHSMDSATYSNILYHRYVLGEKFGEIAAAIGHDYQYTVNMHGWALKAFQAQFLDE